MYARIVDGVLVDTRYRLPESGILDGKHDLRTLDAAVLALHGIHEVVIPQRPDNTATDTFDQTVELIDGAPTVVWVQRPKTQAELDLEAKRAAQAARRTRLTQAVSTLRTWAAQGRNVTVTQINAVAVLQTMVDRQAIRDDRLADLLEDRFDL